ncbi:hypothetical protein HK405_006701 [Cladochytrium tenue]|nr:hypothetical protein HK405_006701 [Cladochytrium tenue]
MSASALAASAAVPVAAATLSPVAPAALAAVLAAASSAAAVAAPRVRLLRAAAAALAYVAAVRFLRRRDLYRRIRTTPAARFVLGKNPAPLADMTPEEARQITIDVFMRSFPFLVLTSDKLALLKTYAVPSISTLLARTRQLCAGLFTPRRVADTSVLINEMTEHPFDHPRSATAAARINWLHAHYRKQIQNTDMIYTLALFITEPLTWVGRHGWRRLTTVERYALGLTYMEVARRMGIRDFPDTVDGVFEFSRALESNPAHFYFHEDNRRVAGATLGLLFEKIPTAALRDQVKLTVVAGIEPHVVRTLGLHERPTRAHRAAFLLLMRLRAAAIANLALPGFEPRNFLLEPLPAGLDARESLKVRRNMLENTESAVYVRPTLWTRWLSPLAVLSRIAGLPVPGSVAAYGDAAERAALDPAQLKVYSTSPEGYLLEEAGPAAFVGKGLDEVRVAADELQRGIHPPSIWA